MANNLTGLQSRFMINFSGMRSRSPPPQNSPFAVVLTLGTEMAGWTRLIAPNTTKPDRAARASIFVAFAVLTSLVAILHTRVVASRFETRTAHLGLH